MYASGRRAESISSPQAASVGLPKSSWFHQLPTRPIACATSRPGAAASRSAGTFAPDRRATRPPTRTPPAIPPQIAESALPDGERPPPLVRHLVPARGEVVEPRADDAGADTPDRDAEDQIPVAAARNPAAAGDRDTGSDAREQHQPVHVDRHRAELERAGRRRRDGRKESHGSILPTRVGRRSGRRQRGSGAPTCR